MKKISGLILFSFLVFHSCMEEPDMQPNTNKGNFEALWKIIDTKYCYLDYKGVDWDSVHTVYQVRVDTVKNEFGFFNLLGSMLGELKDGHVNLYSDFNRSRYWRWFTDYPSNFSSPLVFSDRYLGDDYLIAGGMRYGKIANGTIGYIYYGDLDDVFTDVNISYIFNYFASCSALIVDVRNNGGGYLDLSGKLASYFFTEEKVTGYMAHKTGTGHSDFSSPVKIKTTPHKTIRWERPVAVLTNRMSYSATNEFVCRMKQAPHAVVIGDQTGGGGGLPLSSEIPNGWMVRFSASPIYDADMNHIEWGIEPDIPVEMKPEDEASGYDTIIERAITYLMLK
ncbi:MAG TPA: S41 family peptidase [Paludibacter sp.]|nr:S41 family peptidase [Paludibacter sp.]